MTIYLTDAEYKNHNDMCPVCKKRGIERDNLDSGDFRTFRDTRCPECKSYWVEHVKVYVQGYSDLVDGPSLIHEMQRVVAKDKDNWALIRKVGDGHLSIHCTGAREDVITTFLELLRMEVLSEAALAFGLTISEDEEDGAIVSACERTGLELPALADDGMTGVTYYLRDLNDPHEKYND